VVLEPIADDWSWLDGVGGKLDRDFVAAVKEKPAPQKRPELFEIEDADRSL